MATATTSATPAVEPTTQASIPTTSPHRRPQRKQKANSFLIFQHAAVPHSASAEDLSRHSITEHDSEEEEQPESLYRRLVMMPLLSVSFILSLFLVERSERARRSSEHPLPAQSFWSTFSLQNWLDPEPYQDPGDTTWRDGDAANSSGMQQQGQGPHPKQKQWYMRKKKAKVGKLNITEAFDLSGTVLILLLVFACVLVAVFGWGSVKAYYALMARLRL